ncbi:hypothetical protein VHUM_03672 [Vanrija humicola]|uniref:F-box domain-containing protein n=1 Tax=Vanrija humicola TaxID=5417 RepID=A0A7D8UZM0_VANHU|nr:hypothetical protein VHUM_03672 [Vanrija humicola]
MDEALHDLGGIRVDRPPRPLGLDRIFARAERWKQGAPSAPVRTPSPPPSAVTLALPAPLADGAGASPLGELFAYPDLVPLVLGHLSRPGELATAALVCRDWRRIATRKLYRDIWVRPCECAVEAVLLHLFETLAGNPELCVAVRSLDVRFFPLDITGEERHALEDRLLQAFAQMKNLERLIWTRDRSMFAELFDVVASLPKLQHVELSGHASRLFEPTLLATMPQLRDLRVYMPDAVFRTALFDVITLLCDRPIGGLEGLALICKSFNLINDEMLRALSPYLSSLKRLQLIGCTRITRTGVYDVLREADAIEELILDAPPHSDLIDLSGAPELSSLKTFSLSFPAPSGRQELEPSDMPLLRRTDTLRALELTLSTNGAHTAQRHHLLPVPALRALTSQIDFERLTRLALLNLVIDTDTLSGILEVSPALEELYISVPSRRVLQQTPTLHSAPLRILHANAPESMGPTRTDLAELALVMPKVQQIGSLNRVYEVHRRFDGEKLVVELARWSQIMIPGYFQVWRP